MKYLSYLLVGAVFTSSFAYGNATTRSSDQKTERSADDMYNPCLKQGFFLTADFLYWIAHEEGLEYALDGVKGAQNDAPTPVKPGSTKSPDFEWGPGFRLGAGYTLPKSYWDAGVTWTRFRTDADDSVSHASGAVAVQLDPLIPIFQTPTNTAEAAIDSATFKWRLEYDTLDFELSRAFFPNRYLSLKPHAGIRAVWIDQDISAVYNLETGGSRIDEIYTEKKKIDNDYHAAGFKLGVDSVWNFNSHFGIFANASMSLVGGDFHSVETSDIPQDTPFGPSVSVCNVRNDLFDVIPELELAMGLHAMLGPNKKNYWMELNAGWEYLVWFHQNQILLFTANAFGESGFTVVRERGNLQMMGFMLNAKLHF